MPERVSKDGAHNRSVGEAVYASAFFITAPARPKSMAPE